jgi:hypothetical protein
MITLRRMQWMTRPEWGSEDGYKILVGKFKEKDHFQDLDVDGRMIFKWIVEK